jgi:hypothetical protein
MGAHNAKDLRTHLVLGTFRSARADRYADAPMTPPSSLLPRQRRDLLRGLGPGGRRFVMESTVEYEGWTAPTLALLKQAALTLDRIAALEAAIAADGAVAAGRRGARKEHALSTRVRAELRTLALLLKQLRLER